MSYTLITGASSGIGREFAYFYAAQNKNLILVARRVELLNQVKEELTNRYDVKVNVFGLDITQPESINGIMDWVEQNQIRLDTLINNAGVCHGGAFDHLKEEQVANLLDLNIKALVHLCHQVIPHFKKHQGGRILNVASMAAFVPGPLYALYFASKSFVLAFSEAIREECKPYHIGVSAICPGFVRTDMIGNLPNIGMPLADPKAIVLLGDSMLRTNRAVAVNGIRNNLLVFFTKTMPRSWLRGLMGFLIRFKRSKTNALPEKH